MKRSWDKTDLFLTLTQIITVIVAIATLFFALDSLQPQFLMQNGHYLTESTIDSGLLKWGMRFFLVALGIGLTFIASVFFLSFRDD